jgi:hypothetical protein
MAGRPKRQSKLSRAKIGKEPTRTKKRRQEKKSMTADSIFSLLVRILPSNLTSTHVEAVWQSSLRKRFAEYLDDLTFVRMDWKRLNEKQRELLSDACHDILTNDAPVIESYEVSGSDGPFYVSIRGVPKVYFIQAGESDDLGPFATLRLARIAVDLNYLGDAVLRST